MKTIIVHHRSSHHAVNSGYSRVLDYIEAKRITSKKQIIPYKLAKYIGEKSNQTAGIYDSSSVYKDFELIKTLLIDGKHDNIVHYLNAERDIRHVVNLSSFFHNTSFCGTFHKPPNILEKQIKNIKYLKRLNGAIAVGKNQVDFLKNWLNLENVEYIPHGVDTNFFTPDLKNYNSNNLLFVGQHLRDFDAFNYCVPKIAEKIKDLKVNVVLRNDFFNRIKPHPTIKFHSGISDIELKKIYQETSLLFLPLEDVTACNSLLEAMACGVPIITTDVGGNNAYLSGTDNIMMPKNDKGSLIDASIELLNNEEKLRELGKTNRNRALDFEWNKIAIQIENFYNILL